MKFKITPLNIVAAASFLGAILLAFGQLKLFTFRVSEMKVLFIVLFVMVGLVSFVSDLIFRKMVPSLKRLWIIELTLITLTVVIMVVLKSLLG